jgi:hypothetical protein
MRGAIPPLLQYAFMAWCLVKHRDFTFTVTAVCSNSSCRSGRFFAHALVDVHPCVHPLASPYCLLSCDAPLSRFSPDAIPGAATGHKLLDTRLNVLHGGSAHCIVAPSVVVLQLAVGRFRVCNLDPKHLFFIVSSHPSEMICHS